MTQRISLGHFLMTVNTDTKVVHMINVLFRETFATASQPYKCVLSSACLWKCSLLREHWLKHTTASMRLQDTRHMVCVREYVQFLSESKFSGSKHTKEGWEVFGVKKITLLTLLNRIWKVYSSWECF